MRKKEGISLIVLVITIIVIIILAGAVILSLANNNPIAGATEATFKQNVSGYNAELLIAISNEYLNDYSFRPETFNIGTWDGGEPEGTIKQYIPSITETDGLKFEIQGGALVYVGTNETEQNWFANMGMVNGEITPPQEQGLGVDVIATVNSTVNGQTAAYNNPIIPKGFKAINDGTIWPTDWNSGLVIEDEVGNQFVWVPVDGINVPYAKWTTSGIAWNDASISDDTILAGTVNENTQISTYGGFYIARYEAGNESGTLVSKKGATIWTDIDYYDTKTQSESMYNTDEVKSSLITGTQWDTALRWIENSGKSVTDSRIWGNHSNSISPANVSGFGDKQVAGYSENWKAKNIYDIAGNSWEWTSEVHDSDRVYRGGSHYSEGDTYPSACRGDYGSPTGVSSDLTFRVVLYIL